MSLVQHVNSMQGGNFGANAHSQTNAQAIGRVHIHQENECKHILWQQHCLTQCPSACSRYQRSRLIKNQEIFICIHYASYVKGIAGHRTANASGNKSSRAVPDAARRFSS
jgi:hypothetical protein